MAVDGDRDRTAIEGSGGAGRLAAALGDDGRELLELLDAGRDGYRLNLMLDAFLTDRPRSEASGMPTAEAPSTILALSLSLALSRMVVGPGRGDQVRGRGRMTGVGWRRKRWEEGSMMGIGEDAGRAAGEGESISIDVDRENNAMKLRVKGDWEVVVVVAEGGWNGEKHKLAMGDGPSGMTPVAGNRLAMFRDVNATTRPHCSAILKRRANGKSQPLSGILALILFMHEHSRVSPLARACYSYSNSSLALRILRSKVP